MLLKPPETIAPHPLLGSRKHAGISSLGCSPQLRKQNYNARPEAKSRMKNEIIFNRREKLGVGLSFYPFGGNWNWIC